MDRGVCGTLGKDIVGEEVGEERFFTLRMCERPGEGISLTGLCFLCLIGGREAGELKT